MIQVQKKKTTTNATLRLPLLPLPDHIKKTRELGLASANRFSSRLNSVKDMPTLIKKFPPILIY